MSNFPPHQFINQSQTSRALWTQVCGPAPDALRPMSRVFAALIGTYYNLFPPIIRFGPQKNSEFFSRQYGRKTLANQRKTVKKTLPNPAKNSRFFDAFLPASIYDDAESPIFYPPPSCSFMVAAAPAAQFRIEHCFSDATIRRSFKKIPRLIFKIYG